MEYKKYIIAFRFKKKVKKVIEKPKIKVLMEWGTFILEL